MLSHHRRDPLEHADVRIYRQLRTAHLERAHEFAPASILYRINRYDFDADLATGLDLNRTNTWELVATLVRNRVDHLEINEPLARGGLSMGAAAVLAVRVAGIVRRRRTQVVTYAIENLDPFERRPAPLSKAALRYARDRRLSRWLVGQVDRIAYGTSSAQELYDDVFGPTPFSAEARLFPALPAPCPCLDVHPDGPVTGQVTFLGSLDERKGVRRLLSAWDYILERNPGATLSIVGKGPLLAEVKSYAEEHPSVDLVVDPPRDEIHTILRRTSVLCLLSQRSRSWREQVGLPIVEALSHGCTVVASTETGLADWLAGHGHQVVPPDADTERVATAVSRALESHAARSPVLASLPEVDGRKAADDWLRRP